ncbi:MAG: FKBP-type peptidyl-prolyl cis-trans isomerase [Rhizomicrobium sp.]|jgi:FKBP-type peptidyl-prolyl cis-trans isomerase
MIRLGILVAAFVAFTVSAQAADSALSPAANAAFLAAYAKKPGVYQRPSGLEYRILHNGVGMRPGLQDTVTVYYKGSLINGSVFDATEPGFPAQLKVNAVIPGWTEALLNMRVGDHWELAIPSSLAYGNRGAGGGVIPPNQTLVFDLELVDTTPPTEQEKQQEKEQEQKQSGQSQ